MPIPKEILEVKRPRNTIVIAYGKNKNLYLHLVPMFVIQVI